MAVALDGEHQQALIGTRSLWEDGHAAARDAERQMNFTAHPLSSRAAVDLWEAVLQRVLEVVYCQRHLSPEQAHFAANVDGPLCGHTASHSRGDRTHNLHSTRRKSCTWWYRAPNFSFQPSSTSNARSRNATACVRQITAVSALPQSPVSASERRRQL